MLIAPENLTMRYNLVCALSIRLQDTAGALDLLASFADKMNSYLVTHMAIDPHLDGLRGEARFQQMLSDAQARLAAVRSDP